MVVAEQEEALVYLVAGSGDFGLGELGAGEEPVGAGKHAWPSLLIMDDLVGFVNTWMSGVRRDVSPDDEFVFPRSFHIQYFLSMGQDSGMG